MTRGRAPWGTIVFALAFPLLAVAAPLVAPKSPLEGRLEERLSPPAWDHWLGTDDLGRDVLSRVVYGARVSVGAGLLACVLSLAIGSALGAIAGVGSKTVDGGVLFAIEVVQAFPALVLVAGAAAILPPSFLIAPLLIAATSWTDAARLVRAEARRLNTLPFVEAARASGASPARILFVHVLPASVVPALATAPYVLGAAVLTEAALSFLGLGTPPPTPSWGRALADARGTLTEAWWCTVPPAVALLLFVLASRRLGERLTSTAEASG